MVYAYIQYFETASVLITVILFGKYLESYAKEATASAIHALISKRVNTASLVHSAQGLRSLVNAAENLPTALHDEIIHVSTLGRGLLRLIIS